MTDRSQTQNASSRKGIDVFIDIANASLDLVYALVAAANKAKRRFIAPSEKRVATPSELRLTTLLHGQRPRLRDGDSFS